MAVRKVDHICIVTRNLDKAVDFYTRLLGFSPGARERLDAGNIEIAVVTLGETNIEFVRHDTPPDCQGRDGAIELIGILVDDLPAEIDRLRREGVEFLMPEPLKIGDTGQLIFFRGPSGEKLELLSR